ncbi:MAG: hypothetical protein JWN63_2827 [Candidatus Acidoferrum typicum]|nr:hypothetical protein [Candidatus Acidoferrum typicum]
MRTRSIAFLVGLGLSGPALSGFAESALRQFVGYTVVDVLTITGWRDSDGTGEDGAFKGCKFGRVITFEGNKALKCAAYGYQYAYRPDAVILFKGGIYKMLVEGEVYEMQN